jgi:hypothetical protein
MLRHDLLGVGYPLWIVGMALIAGLAAAGLVFLAGREFLRRYWPSPSPLALPASQDSLAFGREERRRWPRRWGNPVNVLVLEASKIKPSPAVVVNRSQGGLALLLDDYHEVGTVLSVRPAEAQGDIPWIQVEVRHCRKAGRQWLAGCQFVEAPPWDVWVWLG